MMRITGLILCLAATITAASQSIENGVVYEFEAADTVMTTTTTADTLHAVKFIENFRAGIPNDGIIPVETTPLPAEFFIPSIYTSYEVSDTLSVNTPLADTSDAATAWINRAQDHAMFIRRFKQDYWMSHIDQVRYNVNDLPEPPKQYKASVDPKSAAIVIEEINIDKSGVTADATLEVKRKNWIHNFDLAIQFSQAYISPNWYQGGNNNLNILLNAIYSVKLNQAFHPNLLFETTLQYKLAMNSAPDDTLRSYNISENMFQLNSKFGYKAASRWYYTVNLLLKTPVLNNYKSNTTNLTAALFSPGELNVGIGMTYNYENPKKTFKLDTSISPIAYNLKTVMDGRMNPQAYGIEAPHKSVSEIGSSAEVTWMWKIAYNITYNSRLFMFTDYEYLQGDWQNTFTFNINKYLSTNLFVDLRYDSSTERRDDTRWYRWQLKEILSFGFSYKI